MHPTHQRRACRLPPRRPPGPRVGAARRTPAGCRWTSFRELSALLPLANGRSDGEERHCGALMRAVSRVLARYRPASFENEYAGSTFNLVLRRALVQYLAKSATARFRHVSRSGGTRQQQRLTTTVAHAVRISYTRAARRTPDRAACSHQPGDLEKTPNTVIPKEGGDASSPIPHSGTTCASW